MAKKRRSKPKTKPKAKAKSKVKPTPKKGLLLSNNPKPKKKRKPSTPKKSAKKKSRKAKSYAHIKGWITRRKNQAALLEDYKAEREAIKAKKPLAERTKDELIQYIKEQDKRFDILEKNYVITGEYIRLKDGKASKHWTRMRLIPDGMTIWKKMKKDARILFGGRVDPFSAAFHTFAKQIADQYDVTVREVYTFWHSP